MELSPQRRRYEKSNVEYWNESEKKNRNREILELRTQGLSLRQIGDKFLITRERVRQICKKSKEKSNVINR